MTTPTRPTFIDIRSESQASVQRPMRSPRLHVAGEHPPELSPLDAFALQSRLLARQLEESSKAGNRLSRLPPLTTDSPLVVQGRSEFFRSMSQESSSDFGESPQIQQSSVGPGMKPELDEYVERPVSTHPRMSRVPPTPDSSLPIPTPNSFEHARGRKLGSIDETNNGYFGARREQSPSSVDSASIASIAQSMEDAPAPRQSYTSQPSARPAQTMPHSPPRIVKKNSSENLAPPQSAFPKRTSSIKSQTAESIDEDRMSASFHSQGPRKLSTSSSVLSPMFQQRSPSVASNVSDLPRPAFNFSRPISRAGTPGLETTSGLGTPARQASSDSQGSFFLADDSANTPLSMSSECFPDPSGEHGKSGGQSYIYSKFSLPRGKMLQRMNSMEREGQSLAAYRGEQTSISGQPPPSPPTRPTSSSSRTLDDSLGPLMERGQLSHDGLRPGGQPSPSNSRPSTGGRSSEDVQRGRFHPNMHDAAGKRPFTAAGTSDSASTIKAARSQYSVATTMAEIPAEEHVDKAIALHNEGKLNESTYHLRHAAKQEHPTGMLLYALACRHGWGMRANQKEGVEWLRKAAECAGVEIAEDEDNAKQGKGGDVVERRTRKAQLALSIYELGVSHMNGWGIEQDKALALRCFEIAGSKYMVHIPNKWLLLTGF